MTRREQAIKEALHLMGVASRSEVRVAYKAILSDLIDQAEAGKLKEPVVRHFAGINGRLTVYPDGREERS